MPAATTHVEFAKDVYNLLPYTQREKITNKQMYYLGSQGPDLFFFSRASVIPGSLKKYGNLMHDGKVTEVIHCFEEYAGDDPDLNSYIYGYLCHYALDSIAHPLICAVAKYRHETTGIHEGEAHVTMEADIDVWLLHQRGRLSKDYNVWKSLKQTTQDLNKLAEMLHHMLKEVFDADVSLNTVKQSVFEVSFWTGFLYPKKITHGFITTFERITRMPHSLSGMMLYERNDTTIINLDHRKYPARWDENIIISDSFPQLYGKAVLKAEKLIASHEDSDFPVNFCGEPY